MFDFIKEINSTLYKDFDDVNKNIKLKTTITETALQIYSERLLKIINDNEKVDCRNKLSLGKLLENENFVMILKKKYNFSEDLIRNLNIINNLSNDHKHENRSEFISKELKKMYRKIVYCTLNYYNVTFGKKLELNNIDDYYDTLLEVDQELIKNLQEEIRRSYEESNKDKDKQLQEERQKLKIQQQRLDKALEKLSDYNKIKENIIELESKNAESNNIIDNLSEKIAKYEAMIDDKNNPTIEEERNQLLEKLKEQEDIIIKNNIELEKLKNSSKENPTITIDKYEKMIYELNEKITLLENEEIIKKDADNDELFQIQKKLNLKICFDSSYIDDIAYSFRNVSLKNNCKSKYKQFYAVINNLLQRGKIIKPSNFIQKMNLESDELKELIRVELMILTLLKNGRLGDSIWRINYINGNKKIVDIAANDIIQYTEKLTKLANVEYQKPNLDITNSDYNNDELKINVAYNRNYDLTEKYMFYIEDYENELIDNIKEDKIENINYWIEDTIKYKIDENNKNILNYFLENIFGYESFRDGQSEIIAHYLNNNNTIGILPTGSGKSIVYQLSSLLQPKITIVIAPTKELIKDQCRVLENRFGITRISKITSDKDINKAYELKKLGTLKSIFNFVSPERLQSSEFRSKLALLQEENAFDSVVLDEVHCLSEWGHDFRIPYLMVAHTLKQYFPKLKFLGLTATASKSVIKDLMVELNIKDRKDIIFNETYKRDNLNFSFDTFSSEDSLKNEIINELLNTDVTLNGEKTNAALIFMKTGYSIDNFHDFLSKDEYFGNEVGKYYSTEDNSLSTEKFIKNEQSVLISTKAFGMGIDKPNIKLTIHYGIPSSLEAFYQEAGRAGREIGSKAKCKIFTYEYHGVEKELVDEFLNVNTTIDRLKEISNDKKIQFKIDIATNFYFLTKDLKNPIDEATDAISFYRDLYNKIDEDNKCRILVNRSINNGRRKPDDNKPNIEKKLYILHKCGIVNNWEVKYLESQLEFYILFDSNYKNIEYIKSKTKQYIEQYPADNKSTIEKINSINSYSNIIEIVKAMRAWYYNNFVITRRNQLANIYRYATEEYCNSNCSNKIQEVIDDYFNISDILKTSKDGNFVYGFENLTMEQVIKKAVLIKKEKIESSIIQSESEMESVENNKLRMFIAILNLRNGNFDDRNGYDQMKFVLNNVDETEKINLYKYLGESVYNALDFMQKEELNSILYISDKKLYRSVFLENIKNDISSKKYWIPYINNKLNGKDL